MKRINITPRQNYKEKIESIGFDFHNNYWLENAYYKFTNEEIDEIYEASNKIYNMYCTAVDWLLIHKPEDSIWKPFGLTPDIIKTIKRSWKNDDLSLYGRFDFIYQDNQIKLLEFNADTPTSLIEASIIQWNWKEELFPEKDQFNSIHENLVQSWKDISETYNTNDISFVCDESNEEDASTTAYLCSTASEAGINTSLFDINNLRIDEDLIFCTPGNELIKCLFKLYPYEWLFEEDVKNLINTPTKLIEPFWKSLMSNKYILVILYKLFPNSPYLLRTEMNKFSESYCKKPIYSREGANIQLVKEGKIIEETTGEYGENEYIYQELIDQKDFNGKYPIIGSWIIGGESCGIGIRENSKRITDNISNFVPHIISNE